MSELAERIAALSPQQRALFEAMLKKKGLHTPEARGIPRVERMPDGLYPTSIDQERLWFIDQLQPGNTAYNIFTASRITGPLDVGVMERVVNEIVQRHEVLRTTFRVVDGQPMQFIAPTLEMNLSPLDLQHLPEAEREREAQRLATEDFMTPFNLEKGPLIRVRLLRLSPTDHVMSLNMHHSVTDRWSAAVIEKDLGVLYQAFSEGQPSPLPELPIQFADYASWQRGRVQSEVYETQLAYWKKQLAGAPFVLDLPADNPRPAIQNFVGARHYFEYSKELLEALRDLSHREGATMYMTLMAAYKLLLYRYTNQEDMLVGCSIVNRDRPETQNMVGFLLNLLVFRTDLSGNPSFRELLRRERETALGAYANQDLPFGKLVQELRPKQDPSRNPVVQAAFIYLDFPELTTMEPMGMQATHLPIDNGASRFDLTLALTDTAHGLDGSFEYLTELYSRSRIERMAKHLEILLEGIVADPERPIADLPMLAPEERRQLLVEWNDTRERAPQCRSIHELIEAQVDRTPDAVALDFEGRTVGYRELDGRANQLAHYLRSLGVGPEVRVGVLVERSVEQLIGVFGVLKAGGAYVPLDPSYPRERLAFVLKDAGVSLLLTTGELGEAFPSEALRLVRLDADWPEIAAQSDARVNGWIDGDNPAYVIYTSGSTGKPKGVVVSHRSLVNTINAQVSSFPEPMTGALLQMSYSFDGSVPSIFCTLAQGATLVLPREGQQTDPSEVARLVAAKRLSHLCTVPSFYSLLLEQAEAGQLESLRAVHVGAESCPPQLVNRHHQLLPQAALYNEYGPTEATVYCTLYRCQGPTTKAAVPIGRPATNMQIYLLDEHFHPVPVGIPGQLCIGGAGVARGYQNRPDLTAERFIPNPYSTEPGARLYQTGDQARYEEDGQIVFLGRIDHQVKIRGYRIELGEIEAALGEHEAVRQAVALAREDAPGERRLVAYIVAIEGAEPTSQALREHVKSKLPEYMIPAAFVFLDELPLTPTGKVDRRALPAPDETQLQRPAYEAPRTLTEEMLAKLWADVLGITQVGIHDNFFELGGDSILATRLASQVRRSFEIELPLPDLFRHPTVADLAALIEDELAKQMDDLTDEEAEQLLRESQEFEV
ncbi:MAG TPA: amino acid adenylation domain-containing protein [Pyrinomonadaceae bacterium]|jgi:amino acid adenylation domain-containing protein|nr:amino acid adenylation domain-containing protein [Pyrinomonadaceae bacterium]